MLGTTLGAIQSQIEALASEDGTYLPVCASDDGSHASANGECGLASMDRDTRSDSSVPR